MLRYFYFDNCKSSLEKIDNQIKLNLQINKFIDSDSYWNPNIVIYFDLNKFKYIFIDSIINSIENLMDIKIEFDQILDLEDFCAKNFIDTCNIKIPKHKPEFLKLNMEINITPHTESETIDDRTKISNFVLIDFIFKYCFVNHDSEIQKNKKLCMIYQPVQLRINMDQFTNLNYLLYSKN